MNEKPGLFGSWRWALFAAVSILAIWVVVVAAIWQLAT